MTEAKMAEKETRKERAGNDTGTNADPYVLVEDLVSVNNGTMDAFLRASEAVLRGVASLNEEVLSFADKRMRASIDTSQSLVKCSTFAEAMELQSRFARSATEDYLQEATKLLNLSASVTKEGMAQWESHARETAAMFKKSAD